MNRVVSSGPKFIYVTGSVMSGTAVGRCHLLLRLRRGGQGNCQTELGFSVSDLVVLGRETIEWIVGRIVCPFDSSVAAPASHKNWWVLHYLDCSLIDCCSLNDLFLCLWNLLLCDSNTTSCEKELVGDYMCTLMQWIWHCCTGPDSSNKSTWWSWTTN
jgi:hypothetical protein